MGAAAHRQQASSQRRAPGNARAPAEASGRRERLTWPFNVRMPDQDTLSIGPQAVGPAAHSDGGGAFGIGVLAMVLGAQTLYVGVYIPAAPPNYKEVSRAFSFFSGNIR